MSERDIIERTQGYPATVESLSADFRALGIAPGMVILLHSSLSALGWVCGGAVAVILALETAIGEQGTLVMPTHSGDLSDPAPWQNPPVPEAWWDVIRETMPPYDPDLTPTRGVGVVPETFRKQRGVLRSGHPRGSFAAWGARAREITEGHSLDFELGEESPLARVYDLDGWVLLLGVRHANNTSLHLAEYRASYPDRKMIETRAPMLVNGRREWVTLRDIELDESDFDKIGECWARATNCVQSGPIADAKALFMPQRALVDFAVTWMNENRRSQSTP